MCKLQFGYFVVNGITSLERNYQAISSDNVNLECWAVFDNNEIGKEYKAELKVLLPTGKEFSFYTPLAKVKENQIFDSIDFEVPIPIGTYSTAWFVIYDSSGNTICSGKGKGLNCENLIISENLKKDKR